MRTDKRASQKSDKKASSRSHKRGIVGYSKKSALLEEAIGHMNSGKYGRSSAALKELLALDPQNIEARRLFATLHLRLGSLVTARQAFESLANEAIGRQDYWLAESLLREYLAAGPRCVPFLEQLAQVYQEKGDEMAAVVELGKAIEILRDDPDPDHPQKAAQLYSKIRELAPASSVAFQLASLFDVQTGELLVEPVSPSTTPSEDTPSSNNSVEISDIGRPQGVEEYPLPEVMPWELLDEPAGAETETDSAEVTASIEIPEARSPAPPQEAPTVMEAPPELAREETSAPSLSADETTVSSAFSIPWPMPWEQMADASVEILEPESPSLQDGFGALESLLASLRTEEATVAPPSPIEAPQNATTHSELPGEPTRSNQTGTAPLSAPMPWEQISDPAIQISSSEAAPIPPFQDALCDVAPILSEAAEQTAALESTPMTEAPSAGIESPPVDDIQSSEPAPSPEPESPPTSSFSWNSVFDDAWKFTGGTMAPSPPVPLERAFEEEPSAPELLEASETVDVEEPAIAAPSLQAEIVGDAGTSPEAVVALPIEPLPAPISAATQQETASHWNTGEVAVQVHRPSKKKKRWEKDVGAPPVVMTPVKKSLPESASEPIREWKSIEETASPVEAVATEVAQPQADWMKATEAITFTRTEAQPTQVTSSDAERAVSSITESTSTAASAVDVLFAPSPASEDVDPHIPPSWSKPRPRFMARVHRVRIGISSFIGSCFSTTRSLTFLGLMLAIATVAVTSVGMGTLAFVWMAMEEPPTSLYQTLTISPPRIITEAKKNGYLLLLGFDAPEGQDPVQVGYERKAQWERDRSAGQICMNEELKTPAVASGASDQLVKGWMRSGDLLTNIKGQGGSLKSLISRQSTALSRYQQWLSMPFDDWGFGQPFSPNCPHVLLAHRLFVLEGFNQDVSTGLDRLEADVQAWRGALGQAKTLPMKMLAVTAVQDDVSVASGLLSRTELDGTALARLSKMVRPLDQVELSVRWPMQSQFVSATKAVPSELKDDQAHDRPWHASVAAAVRLPVQRRANAYAEYYEAANKAVAGGRYTNLPKVSTFVRTPPSGVIDYLANPVEHIVGIEPLPSWEPFVYRMVEMDAQLRLAGLQTWLRRGAQDGDVLMRLAKAGQAYYDPFTGLPMLVNQRKGVIYSVGRDGKDQEGDSLRDVTATIPAFSLSDARRSSASTR